MFKYCSWNITYYFAVKPLDIYFIIFRGLFWKIENKSATDIPLVISNNHIKLIEVWKIYF